MTAELTATGYLHLSAALVEAYFPSRSLVALVQGGELWLLPVAGRASGGLLLKQRNRAGDCSVLIWEILPPGTAHGLLEARWDAEHGALRLRLLDGDE